ncbi:MAG TPA: response regulator transcription factor [Streptosporangiaceae bacterium]|nr:response regulator transcription factor [Streptosporangiaceae bacterium]
MSEPREHADAIRVLIVEDHPVVAEGLSSLLEDYPDLTVAAIAGSVADAIATAERVQFDVAMVDFHLPDGTGADAADGIRASCPSAAIVFLSADDSDKRLLTAIESGASSYLLKSASGDEIVESIRAAAAGRNLIPAGAIADALARDREIAREHSRQAEVLSSLTPREKEILALMAEGADNRAVARQLHISYATVRTHVRSILTKLGARSQLDAVAKASQLGFHGLHQRFTRLQRAFCRLWGSLTKEGLITSGGKRRLRCARAPRPGWVPSSPPPRLQRGRRAAPAGRACRNRRQPDSCRNMCSQTAG